MNTYRHVLGSSMPTMTFTPLGAHVSRTSVCRLRSVRSHGVPSVNTCAWYGGAPPGGVALSSFRLDSAIDSVSSAWNTPRLYSFVTFLSSWWYCRIFFM